jgi:hypothetical protein
VVVVATPMLVSPGAVPALRAQPCGAGPTVGAVHVIVTVEPDTEARSPSGIDVVS